MSKFVILLLAVCSAAGYASTDNRNNDEVAAADRLTITITPRLSAWMERQFAPSMTLSDVLFHSYGDFKSGDLRCYFTVLNEKNRTEIPAAPGDYTSTVRFQSYVLRGLYWVDMNFQFQSEGIPWRFTCWKHSGSSALRLRDINNALSGYGSVTRVTRKN